MTDISVYIGLTQADYVYQLTFFDSSGVWAHTLHGSLEDFEVIARDITHKVSEQRKYDREAKPR